MSVDLRVVPAEELDANHPFWDLAAQVLDELAPVTRRNGWWETEGPGIIIFRALVAAKKRKRP